MSGYYDWWRQWYQRNAMEAAQAQIAQRDLNFQAWADETRREIAWLTARRDYEGANQRQAVLERMTDQHLTEIAELQTQAEQQIADIDADYAQKEIEHERSEAESRARWAAVPNNTPRDPMPDWHGGDFTPAPAYEPRNSTDTPLDTPADAPEGTSIFDTLRAWFG